MEKYDLTDCSIIIPVEIDCKERLEHLHFQLEYFPRFFSNYELILVEHGKEPKVKIKRSGIRYSFIKGEDEFATSKISNIGVLLAKNPFFYKCDTDVCIYPKAFFDALEKFKSRRDLAFMLPYNGVSFTIADPLRNELLNSFDFDKLPYVKPEEADQFKYPCMFLKNKNSTGLLHLFRTSVFKELGGYNEEYVGWGYEDDEIVNRFSRLGHPLELLEGYNCFHFNHPTKMAKLSQTAKNFLLANLPNTLSPGHLREYIKSWSRF